MPINGFKIEKIQVFENSVSFGRNKYDSQKLIRINFDMLVFN